MREIEFRGKNKDSGEWVYGSLDTTLLADGLPTIAFYDNENFYCSPYVDPKTIGQLTGIKDIKGNGVYDGDILKLAWGYDGNYEVDYDAFIYDKQELCWHSKDIEIIGNIHDNPELLESRK